MWTPTPVLGSATSALSGPPGCGRVSTQRTVTTCPRTVLTAPWLSVLPSGTAHAVEAFCHLCVGRRREEGITPAPGSPFGSGRVVPSFFAAIGKHVTASSTPTHVLNMRCSWVSFLRCLWRCVHYAYVAEASSLCVSACLSLSLCGSVSCFSLSCLSSLSLLVFPWLVYARMAARNTPESADTASLKVYCAGCVATDVCVRLTMVGGISSQCLLISSLFCFSSISLSHMPTISNFTNKKFTKNMVDSVSRPALICVSAGGCLTTSRFTLASNRETSAASVFLLL